MDLQEEPVNRRHLISTFLLRFFVLTTVMFFTVRAYSTGNLSLIYERHFDAKTHQTAIVFESSDVKYISNSSFLEDLGMQTKLGLFSAKQTQKLGDLKKYLLKVKAAKKDFADSDTERLFPHGLKIRIDGKYVRPNTTTHKYLSQYFLKLKQEDLTAKPQDSVSVTRTKFGETEVKYFGDKKPKRNIITDCKESQHGKGMLCSVAGFGYAYFLK